MKSAALRAVASTVRACSCADGCAGSSARSAHEVASMSGVYDVVVCGALMVVDISGVVGALCALAADGGVIASARCGTVARSMVRIRRSEAVFMQPIS